MVKFEFASKMPKDRVDILEKEIKFLIEHLSKYDSSMAINILHTTFVSIIYRLVSKELRTETVNSFAKAALTSFEFWDSNKSSGKDK